MSSARQRVVFAAGYEALFEAGGLASFDTIMELSGLEVFKAVLAEKQVHRLVVDDQPLVLKRHFEIRKTQALKLRFAQSGTSSAAFREWEALHRLDELGVAGPKPVAYGEERRGALVSRAFVVATELQLEHTLEDLVEQHGHSPTSKQQRLRRRLAGLLGERLACLHRGGFNHRDCYLGHWAIGPTKPPELYILDLDRVRFAARLPQSWIVKDLAGLDFSASLRLVSTRERLRVLRAYLGGSLKGQGELMRAVSAKSASILAHAQRKIARGDKNIHINP